MTGPAPNGRGQAVDDLDPLDADASALATADPTDPAAVADEERGDETPPPRRRRALRRPAWLRPPAETDAGTPGDDTDEKPRRFGAGAMPWPHVAGRVALWAVVALVFISGLVNIVAGDSEPTSPAPEGPAVIPDQAAGEAFAARFVTDWLSEAQPALSRYVPAGLDSESLGWPRGEGLVVVDAMAVATRLVDEDRVVTVAARTEDARWLYIDVPLRVTSAERITLAGTPSLVPGPRSEALEAIEPANDTNRAEELRPVVEQFLEAVAAGGDELDYLLTDGAEVPSFGGSVTFSGLSDLTVEPNTGGERAEAIATVRWQPQGLDGQAVTSAYRLTLTRQGGRWYVASFETAPLIGPGASERAATTTTTAPRRTTTTTPPRRR